MRQRERLLDELHEDINSGARSLRAPWDGVVRASELGGSSVSRRALRAPRGAWPSYVDSGAVTVDDSDMERRGLVAAFCWVAASDAAGVSSMMLFDARSTVW